MYNDCIGKVGPGTKGKDKKDHAVRMERRRLTLVRQESERIMEWRNLMEPEQWRNQGWRTEKKYRWRRSNYYRTFWIVKITLLC